MYRLKLKIDYINKDVENMRNDYMSVDIGPETAKLYEKAIKKAKTVVENGLWGFLKIKNLQTGQKGC